MPKRTDISSILVIGAGPIIIGQACEFDYSGTQAIKALKEEGYRVVLVNSNPATIMTDPEFADATYVEPITPEIVAKIIAKERPDALLPTMGGQTALNCALALFNDGTLAKYGVKMIGADADAIDKAENRQRFREAMDKIGLESARSGVATTLGEALAVLERTGLPSIIRPSFTLGGTGGGIAYNRAEFETIVRSGLEASPTTEVLIEESLLGWKEFEMEVVRDRADNAIIICAIENVDPMGVHTGDSITVAPALTLTDKEYQIMRSASIAVLREIGVETGGSNVQFAVNPKDGRLIVIEMNPRVSRSSALASKATGFPIARVAAKLAVGYTLDEITNEITGATPAAFEPTIDYVVTKIPRFAFEKFKGTEPLLSTAMKSVGEVMAIGRNFKESLQKALRGLETGLDGFNRQLALEGASRDVVVAALSRATPDRLLQVAQAFREGFTVDEINAITHYDPWFLRHIEEIVAEEQAISANGLPTDADGLRRLKAMGFSDKRLATLAVRSVGVAGGMAETQARRSGLLHDALLAMAGATSEDEVRALRERLGVLPVFKRIDSCAAEFEAITPYMYSTYEAPSFGEPENEAWPSEREKIVILGGGPNRIGQGIEFDYCCVHACFALSEAGYETIMVNCNPETVSTDYDTSDRLYFEPLTAEDVLEVLRVEQSRGTLKGVIVQFGGQTPLKLAGALEAAGIPILGTSPDAIDLAEDRERFAKLVNKLGLLQPQNGIARSRDEALAVAHRIGYPVLLRPSYVLGGRAMEIVDGVHSGDSACTLPPYNLPAEIIAEMERQAEALALNLGVVGLMNVQFAVKDGLVYLIEVNPRASRTVPFVAKAIGQPIAKFAARIMAGEKLADLPPIKRKIDYMAVKEAVFPWARFPGADPVLTPEMKSTGEVMGIDRDFPTAYIKSQLGEGTVLPERGIVFVSVKDSDKTHILEPVRQLVGHGFDIIATGGTQQFLAEAGLPVERVNKVAEGRRHIVDRIVDGEIALIFNTTEGWQSLQDSKSIRASALQMKVPYYTTAAASAAVALAITSVRVSELEVRSLQDYYT
ncbi:MAG: carbamoyl phosphate synthase large subunit [Sphingomonadales bacterium 32-68-7]|nr:MAG: carbamoyl phosphate synthase large subunit [Sphingomonadales bacterium 32-68-7]